MNLVRRHVRKVCDLGLLQHRAVTTGKFTVNTYSLTPGSFKKLSDFLSKIEQPSSKTKPLSLKFSMNGAKSTNTSDPNVEEEDDEDDEDDDEDDDDEDEEEDDDEDEEEDDEDEDEDDGDDEENDDDDDDDDADEE